jgi:hypothetical protein
MQTFLPYPLFDQSARALDGRRLNKQIIECLQIYDALTGVSTAWGAHPAVAMWRGYTDALVDYGAAMYQEWLVRKITGASHRSGVRLLQLWQDTDPDYIDPPWLGDPAFHAAHRSILLGKDYAYYGQFGWAEQPAVKNADGSWPYVWPSV